jgi:hypothetical protein
MLGLLCVFIMRMIMLWILIVLSPLAFMLSILPGKSQSYASQFWGQFTQYLVNGPVLAFFIWLALVTISNLDTSGITIAKSGDLIPTKIGEPMQFMSFILAIGFLVGGMMISQQIGGMGASVGSGMFNSMTGKAKGIGKKVAIGGAMLAGAVAWSGTKKVGNYTKAWIGNMAPEFVDVPAKIKETVIGGKDDVKKNMAAGAAAGAVIGSVVPFFGTITGALMGAIVGIFGKGVGKGFDAVVGNKPTQDKQRFDAYSDQGARKTIDGVDYDWINADGSYQNSAGKILTDDSGNAELRYGVIEDVDTGQKYSKKSSTSDDLHEIVDPKLGVTGNSHPKGLKQMTAAEADFYARYANTTHGEKTKDSVQDEKVQKLLSSYKELTTDMLKRFLVIEQNGTKQMAIALALATKNGFKNSTDVIAAKEKIRGNGVVLGKFDDEMNKNNMIINNTDKAGNLDTMKVGKLISSGKAEWKNQDMKNMTADGFKLMALHTADNFGTQLKAALKTNKDRTEATTQLGASIDKKDFANKTNQNLRLAYAKLSGDFEGAYHDDNTGAVDQPELIKALQGMSDFESLGEVTDAKLNSSSEFGKAFLNAAKASRNILVKIATSNKLSNDKIKKLIDIARTDTGKDGLYEYIKTNPKLRDI